MKVLVRTEVNGSLASEVVTATKNEKGRWTGARSDGLSGIADTPMELADGFLPEPRIKRLVNDEQLGRVYR